MFHFGFAMSGRGGAVWKLARATSFALLVSVGCQRSPTPADAVTSARAPRAGGPGAVADSPSFTQDIAPLVWSKCARCHRAGASAPFALLTYDDVSKHANQIAAVTNSGFMPPWLADSAYPFENDLRLTQEQKALFQQWADNGAPEGDPRDLPQPPAWPDGWTLGKPDLVVSMPEPFTMPLEGPDVYRNFIVPIPVDSVRYVRAVEFRPDNHRIVHHAFILLDPTRRLRKLAAEDGLPGFEGMDVRGAVDPDGHFVGWQPGREPYQSPEGMAWRLYPGTDLVLQVHMQPTGKQESLQASVGLYFTDEPPKQVPVKAVLRSIDIDIPAGVPDYAFEDQFTLPLDVTLLAVAPHAHYLCKEMHGAANFPDGTKTSLLEIKDWDLNWQREYRYAEPIFLPAGTTLFQRFVYDNSSANVRNPHNPPRRVRYGPEATDEMGSLWFQLVPRDPMQRKTLETALIQKSVTESYRRHTATLREDPSDTHANVELGKIALMMRKYVQAISLFRRAVESDPGSPDAHYYLGTALVRSGNDAEGRAELRRAIQLDTQYLKAHHDLGWADYLAGNLEQAERRFHAALRINPHDAEVLESLGMVYLKAMRYANAADQFRRALEIRPDKETLKRKLQQTRKLIQPD